MRIVLASCGLVLVMAQEPEPAVKAWVALMQGMDAREDSLSGRWSR